MLPSSRAPALALAASLLAACSGAGGARDPGPPTRTFGGDRPVTLTVPPAIEPGRRYPLVLVLHGYGSAGSWHVLYFGLGTLAADAGAFVLAPDGTRDPTGRRFWDAGPSCCNFAGPAVDDVAYLGGLLDAVMAEWPVDPSRVVVIGHSNGGFMAYRLACERADVVTAIGVLAGAAVPAGVACAPAAPVSVLHAHGDLDETIPYAGGDVGLGPFPGAVASAEGWAALDGCGAPWTDGEPLDVAAEVAGAETATRAAGGCPAGIDVALWTLEGAGHVPRVDEGGGREMVDWLLAHPRP